MHLLLCDIEVPYEKKLLLYFHLLLNDNEVPYEKKINISGVG